MAPLGGTSLAFRPSLIETVTDEDFQSVAPGRVHRGLPKRATSVRLQILEIQVMSGLKGWLGRSSHPVTFVTSVVDGMSDRPVEFQGRAYEGIKDGDHLPLGPVNDPKAVYNVYLREGRLPRTLAFSLLVLRSNEEIRDVAKVISEAMADERYKKLSDTVTTAVSGANPVYGTVLEVAQQSIELIASYLKAKPDDQLGYYQANYTNRFDGLGVGRHPSDAHSFPVDHIRLAYELDAR